MIPKSDLVPGCMYKGTSRNTSEAVWDGKIFHYLKSEWYGDVHNETIKHPDDDSVYDVFVPEAEIQGFRIIPKTEMKQAHWYKVFGSVEEAMWVDGVFLYDFGTKEKEAYHLDDGKDYPCLPYAEILK